MSRTLTRQRSSYSSVQDAAMNSTPATGRPTRKLQPTRLPVVDQTSQLLQSHRLTATYGRWVIANLFLIVICYCEIPQLLLRVLLGISSVVGLSYATSGLAVIFTLNTFYNLYKYLSWQFFREQVTLTRSQKQLLGVSEEQGILFQPQPPATATPSGSIDTPRTPSSYPIRRSSSRTSPVAGSSSSVGLTHQISPSRLQYSPSRTSTDSTPIGQPTSLRSLSASSALNQSQASNVVLNQSQSSNNSPFLNSSPGFRRWTPSPARKSIGGCDENMMDVEKVDELMRHEEELDAKRGQPITSPPSGLSASLWSYGRAAYEYVPTFTSYQLATRSQTQPSASDEDAAQNPLLYEQMWKLMKVDRNEVVQWSENLRKWIAQTVLEPLTEEITDINNRLTQMGSSELHIGSTSLASLKNLAATRVQQIPTLSSIIPYLEASTNQAYLFTRWNELATGGSLRAFKWDEGGLLSGKAWSQELPTDTQLITHLFCTYMDTHLPANPRYADGKSFSGLHFLSTPLKPTDKKSSLCLYQSKTHKPHFKVLIEDEVFDIPQGRNNLFHAIAIFLNFVKKNNHGMLERVNLGASGINILWTLES